MNANGATLGAVVVVEAHIEREKRLLCRRRQTSVAAAAATTTVQRHDCARHTRTLCACCVPYNPSAHSLQMGTRCAVLSSIVVLKHDWSVPVRQVRGEFECLRLEVFYA
jgi:hypothetical protein